MEKRIRLKGELYESGMIMNSVIYLASKYLKFKASDRGLSAVALIAFLTIVISGAAAVVILSAANGFHHNFMQKLMTKDAHISILGTEEGLYDYEDIIIDVKDMDGVISAVPYFDGQALLKGSYNVWGAYIKGIPADYYYQDEDLKEQFTIVNGVFDLTEANSIVLGENLAVNLGASVGSVIKLTVYNEEMFSLQYRFKVTGIFSAGYAEYDTGLAFISFEDAQMIYDAEDAAFGIAVKVEEPFRVEKYKEKIAEVVPEYMQTWKEMNRANLLALQNEKILMLIILFIFFVVVFFNILSTMIAMVLDKKEEIGIMKAMGLPPRETMSVFLFDGFFLGVIGSSLGIFIGLFLTVALNTILRVLEIIIDFINYGAYFLVSQITPVTFPTHFEFFKSSVYYITHFPIKIVYGDLVFVALLSVIVSSVAVIFPAVTASRMRPVEVLRND